MDETAILQQVKQYMDALLRGTDPVSGAGLPADSALRREKLTGYFRAISQELQAELDGQEQPMPLSGAMALLTRPLGFTGCRGYLSNAAEKWLIQEGFLAAGPDPAVRTLTPKGQAAGLSLSEPNAKGYISVRCTRSARELLRSSLLQIMEVERAQWEPLLRCLTPEWHARAAASPAPLKVTELLRLLHGLLPPDLPRRFTTQQLTTWMVRRGLMDEVFRSGGLTRRPTWEGRRLGITVSERTVTWSAEAQQFILDNLEALAGDMASGDAYRLGYLPEELTGVREAAAGMEYAAGGENLFRLEDRANTLLAGIAPEIYKLPRNLILAWLSREGYYTIQTVPGDTVRRRVLTDKGLAAGIGLDEKNYFQFSADAQRFVMEHLEEVWDLFLELKLPDR